MAILENGHKTLVTFAEDPTLEFLEVEVTPPGMSGGSPIDLTTMHNDTVRTFASTSLITAKTMTITALYDVDVYTQLLTMINNNQEITTTFPDGKILTFWGWVQDVTFETLASESAPRMTIIVQPSNRDGSGDEITPAVT